MSVRPCTNKNPIKNYGFTIVMFIVGLLFVVIIITACINNNVDVDSNGIPDYFIEPDGFVIAEIHCDENKSFFIMNKVYYGYIKKLDYDNFKNNNLKDNLVVLNPYTEGQSVTVKSDTIVSIEIGEYKDLRKK